jgi:hypothetical protein
VIGALVFSRDKIEKRDWRKQDMTSLAKKLYVANGRWKDRQHIYVAGYSKTDCINILEELAGYSMTTEMNKYFNKGCWGKTMEGITPERGAWVTTSNDRNPKRVYPVGAETVIKKNHYFLDPESDFSYCHTCLNKIVPVTEYPCNECLHYAE